MSFPIRLPTMVTISSGQTCPSQDVIYAERRKVESDLEMIYSTPPVKVMVGQEWPT